MPFMPLSLVKTVDGRFWDLSSLDIYVCIMETFTYYKLGGFKTIENKAVS